MLQGREHGSVITKVERESLPNTRLLFQLLLPLQESQCLSLKSQHARRTIDLSSKAVASHAKPAAGFAPVTADVRQGVA